MAGGHSVIAGNVDHLIRSEVWSNELKEVLQEQLEGTNYVKWLADFPGGSSTLTIPSISGSTVRNYQEDTAVVYDALDTGEFQFQIDQYLSSATYITNKAKQDVFYANELIAKFVPAQQRAIMEHVEAKIFGLQGQQTLANANTINGAKHRFRGGNASITSQLGIGDFSYAKYALKKANVPMTNLVALVPPEVEYLIENQNLNVNTSYNQMWEPLIETGATTGTRFIRNIMGFDVYVSNHLADITSEALQVAASTSSAPVTNGKASMFFSADQSVLPFVGAWAQMPKVDSEYNKDYQRDEFVTTARYGVKLYRPENLVVCVHSVALS